MFRNIILYGNTPETVSIDIGSMKNFADRNIGSIVMSDQILKVCYQIFVFGS